MTTRISELTRAKLSAIWPDLLERVIAAQPLDQICKAHDITRSQLKGYRHDVPGARDEWMEARKESAQTFLEQMIAVTNNPDIDPSRVRVMCDSLKFLIERLDPDSFSPRTRAEITHKVIDLNQAIRDANARLSHVRQPRIERDVTHETQLVTTAPLLSSLL